MKTLLAAACAVLLAVLVAPVSAQDERTIPFSGYSDNPISGKEVDTGDPCVVTTHLGLPAQVLVTDETGTIVTTWDITGTWNPIDERSVHYCTFDAAIPVPEAAFYTVYLGSERAYTYSAEDFPIAQDKAINIVIPDDE